MTEQAVNFTAPTTEAELQAVAERLRERNFEVVIVDDGAAAKDAVLARLPEGAHVNSGKSKTLEDAGILQELMESDRWSFIRKRTLKMDRRTQGDEIRKLTATPDVMVTGVQALTEAGQAVLASASGSQIGPVASGARQVILVIGSQKLVPDLETAWTRIREHVQPYEDARLREQMGVGTKLTRVLVMEGEFVAGRTTVVLVRQPVGV